MNKMDTNHPIDQEKKKEKGRRRRQEETNPNWIKVLIKSSSKSIIHFGGLGFSPHQHPRSIEFDETSSPNHHNPRSTEVHKVTQI